MVESVSHAIGSAALPSGFFSFFFSLFAAAPCFPLGVGVGAGGLELAGTTGVQIDMVVGRPRGMLVAGVLASAPIAWV